MIPKVQWTFKWYRLALFVVVCFPRTAMAQTVSYNYAGGVNFAELKTYRWVDMEGAAAADPSLDRSIHEAIEVQLGRKGLTKSGDRAQVLILYQTSVGREKTIRIYSSEGFPWAYGPGWILDQSYGYSHGYNFVGVPPMSTATDEVIPIGNLVFDMYDSVHKDLIWRAEVSNALNFVADTDKRWKQLNKAIASLFGPYPPKLRK
jgi:Domain of unknown function (DUF4136)